MNGVSEPLRGVILCRVDERHDERWLLEALPTLVDLPGVDGIDVDRRSTTDGEFLRLGVEFATRDAWERFTSRDEPCHLLAALEFELERDERP